MKRLIFITFISIAAITANAQSSENTLDKSHKKEKKLFAVYSVGTGVSIGNPSVTPLLLQGTGYYRLSEKWAVGIGNALSFYEGLVSPLYGSVRYQIGRTRKFTPFVDIAMGYSFSMEKNVN